MIATVRKQPNALSAMTHTEIFQATVQHGKKRFFWSNIRDQLHSSKRNKSLEQLWAPRNCYASITKGAGVHVKCTNAKTQTDETYNVQLQSTASGGNTTHKPGQNAGVDPPPAHQTNAGGNAHQTNAGGKLLSATKPPTSRFEKLKKGAALVTSFRPTPADQVNATKQNIDPG